MAVTVAKGVAARIRKNPGGIVIQVQRSSDPQAATRALSEARAEIAELDGGWQSAPGLSPGDRNGPTFVGNVIVAPEGPVLYVDGGFTPEELLTTIPEIVRRRLEEAGVSRAVVASPNFEDNSLNRGYGGRGLSGVPRAAILHLYPPPKPRRAPRRERREVPPGWLEEAAAWIQAATSSDERLWVRLGPATFPVGFSDALATLVQARRTGSVTLVAGDLQSRIRVVQGEFISRPQLALALGGPASTDEELVEAVDALAEVARRLAPTLSYAHVSVMPTFLALNTGAWLGVGDRRGHVGTFPDLADELAWEALPWQLLGPGHLRRLQAGGADLQRRGPNVKVRSLAEGKVEVQISEPWEWLPDSNRGDEVQDEARQVLAPCLPSREELEAALRSWWSAEEGGAG